MRRALPAIIVALLMTVCLVSFTPPGWSAQAGGRAVRWEYKVVESPISFNELGDDGWELVAVYPGFKTGVYAYFKRPKR
jgi:hypothetical protein